METALITQGKHESISTTNKFSTPSLAVNIFVINTAGNNGTFEYFATYSLWFIFLMTLSHQHHRALFIIDTWKLIFNYLKTLSETNTQKIIT